MSAAVSSAARTCPLCEAMCGLRLEVNDGSVASIRGDSEDVFSRGYLCPKALALQDIHEDADRLRQPLRKTKGGWEAVSWNAVLSESAQRLAQIRRRYGNDAVAVYFGNPITHSYSATLAGLVLSDALGSKNVFSTASVDHLPHMVAAYFLYGNRALLPVPDIDKTDFLIVLGANPVVSNGSVMSAPDVKRRLGALRARGGKLVVVDPRRTETAQLADTHVALRPGTDVFLLLALLHVVFETGRVRLRHLAGRVDGVDELGRLVEGFPPERVAEAIGVEASLIRRLAIDFADANRAACYGRLGICTQEFGALSCWLVNVLNIVTGNLDREGGSLWTTPAADLPSVARMLGESGSFGRWHSRVRGLPEFSGELPLAALSEEIETPGRGQIRALITFAGNPVLSGPNGERLERALSSLDLLVAVDIYMNETTRLADYVLPGPGPLERDHFDLLLNSLAVRNVVRYCRPVFPKPRTQREDWAILATLAEKVSWRSGPRAWAKALTARAFRTITPRRVIALLVRFGPHGKRLSPFGRGLTLRALARSGRTVDLGPLRGEQLAKKLGKRHRIDLAAAGMLKDASRVERALSDDRGAHELLLIGRRQLRDNNSWMHNSARLMRGPSRCVLYMHPADAESRGVRDDEEVLVSSEAGSLSAPVRVTDEIRPGVVSLPHGYGHGRAGTRLTVANANRGVSVNAVTDDRLVDELSGASRMNGVPVTVRRFANASSDRVGGLHAERAES